MALWDACAGRFDEKRARRGASATEAWIWRSTTDIAAFVKVFPPADDDETMARSMPVLGSGREHAKAQRSRSRALSVWADQGLIEPTEGNIIDYDAIRKRIREDGERFNIREIAFDRWNATQLTTQLDGDGFTMVPFGQGFQSMAAPTEELRKLLVSRQLAHGGNEVLRWMASNVAVKQDPAGNQKPDKSKSSEKIDGIVALIMGLGRAIVQPNHVSVYESHGIESIWLTISWIAFPKPGGSLLRRGNRPRIRRLRYQLPPDGSSICSAARRQFRERASTSGRRFRSRRSMPVSGSSRNPSARFRFMSTGGSSRGDAKKLPGLASMRCCTMRPMTG